MQGIIYFDTPVSVSSPLDREIEEYFDRIVSVDLSIIDVAFLSYPSSTHPKGIFIKSLGTLSIDDFVQLANTHATSLLTFLDVFNSTISDYGELKYVLCALPDCLIVACILKTGILFVFFSGKDQLSNALRAIPKLQPYLS